MGFARRAINSKRQHFYASSAAPRLCVTLNKCGRVRVWLQARVRQCEREESLELQYCAQIISDYSHVCDPAGTFKLKRARKLNLPSRSNQADPARWISKSGCLYFSGKMVGFNTQTFVYFYYFFSYLCLLPVRNTRPQPKWKHLTAPYLLQLTGIFSILFAPQWVSHTLSDLFVFGPEYHILFHSVCFIHNALKLIHKCVKILSGGAIKSFLTANENGRLHCRQGVRNKKEIKETSKTSFLMCVCVNLKKKMFFHFLIFCHPKQQPNNPN